MISLKTQEMRIHWVDSLKALGIFLVVLTHHEEEIPKSLLKYVYSFHMPLFFFISGFLYRPERYENARQFIYRRVRTLVIPYFVLSFVSFAAVVGFSIYQNGIRSIDAVGLGRSVTGIFVSAQDIIPLPNMPMWFITCLFVVEVLFYFINKVTTSNRTNLRLLILALIASSVFGYIYSNNVPVRLPWGIDTAFNAIPFYGVGFIASIKLLRHHDRPRDSKILLLATLLLLVSLWSFDKNGFVNLVSNRTGGHYFFFYLSSFSAIILLVLISMALPRVSVIEYVGMNSIVILAFHLNAYSLIWRIPRLTDYVLSNPLWGGHLLGILFLSILQILFTLPAIQVIRTCFPYVLSSSVTKGRNEFVA